MGYRPGSQTIHTRFPVHTRRVGGTFPCPECGKKRKIQQTLEETENPFNRNAEGNQKTPREIRQHLAELAKNWKPSQRQLHHTKCWEEAHGQP